LYFDVSLLSISAAGLNGTVQCPDDASDPTSSGRGTKASHLGVKHKGAQLIPLLFIYFEFEYWMSGMQEHANIVWGFSKLSQQAPDNGLFHTLAVQGALKASNYRCVQTPSPPALHRQL
jgi:hypothetical protein